MSSSRRFSSGESYHAESRCEAAQLGHRGAAAILRHPAKPKTALPQNIIYKNQIDTLYRMLYTHSRATGGGPTAGGLISLFSPVRSFLREPRHTGQSHNPPSLTMTFRWRQDVLPRGQNTVGARNKSRFKRVQNRVKVAAEEARQALRRMPWHTDCVVYSPSLRLLH